MIRGDALTTMPLHVADARLQPAEDRPNRID
ncbi:hypothetical protein C100_10635 [Sphingobium sp. C100]|nr:hypothetical protein C100_10635 [Sphingobium sp. C100]